MALLTGWQDTAWQKNITKWVAALVAVGTLAAGAGCTSPASDRAVPVIETGPALQVTAGLFDPARPDTLGLADAPGARTFEVYNGHANGRYYNHGAVIFKFKNRFYMQWQSSLRDEDADDTQVLYSVSDDGEQWQPAQVLVPARANAVVTNGGWWSDGETLVAYVNVWPKAQEPRGGYAEALTSLDGKTWSGPVPITGADGKPVAGVIEQDMRTLQGGRLLTTVHAQPGLIATPYYTDDPLGLTGWRAGVFENLPHKGAVSRELEPSWFVRSDGSLVMVFRDQGSSFKVLAAVSRDRGETWSQAEETNMPDSRAKQSAGNLPGGKAFVVNNPSGSKTRIPLTVTVSDNGQQFDRAYLVRAGGEDLPPMQADGKYKRVGYSYPKSFVSDGFLYVAYAVNKEDIAVTRIPAKEL